jgi:hypothetical protein
MVFYSPMSEFMSANLSIIVEDGLPVEYSCPWESRGMLLTQRSNSVPRSGTAANDLRTIEIVYSYELAVIDPNESLEEVMVQELPTLEYAILYMAAKATHLLKCELEHQDIGLWADDLTINANKSQPNLISLASHPLDDWDIEKGKHFFFVGHFFLLSVINLPIFSSFTRKQPMPPIFVLFVLAKRVVLT